MPPPDAHAALHAHFGFRAFRPGQEQAVRAALEGRDALVVMPTGAGKSLCYQLPALMGEGLTLVVSPLVSLMEDQVQALARRAPGQVALVSSQQGAAANDEALAAAVRGAVRVLYVAPERFSSPGFARALERARVGLFVVDEAHCVSQWGHDFRPDYFRLADAARWLGARSILASTATATPAVAADIIERLGLREPVRVSTGFDRPNLSWVVVQSDGEVRERQLVAALTPPGATPAIVYAGTRRHVDALAEGLRDALGRPVLAYHAGLERGARAAAQRRFMGGEVDVVVATNAFGMGVDKADVRTVVHATVPPSVEAYYQEAGRAGRDGAPAKAILLASPKDKGLHVHFIERGAVTEAQLERVAVQLEEAAGGAPLPGFGDVAPRFDVALEELGGPAEADRLRAIVGALARAGVILPAPSTADRLCGRLLAAFDDRAREACRATAEEAERARWQRYRAIWGFVESGSCRRAAILEHFGDGLAAPAGAGRPGCCDVCDDGLIGPELRAGQAPVPDLQGAIRALRADHPGLDAERVVAVLTGARSSLVRRERLDGLPGYGTFAALTAGQVRRAVAA